MPSVSAEVALALAAIDSYWTPQLICRVHEQDVKVAKLLGELAWYTRDTVDEMFVVVYGTLRIQLEGAAEITVKAGEVARVPAGVAHNPVADREVGLVLIEAA